MSALVKVEQVDAVLYSGILNVNSILRFHFSQKISIRRLNFIVLQSTKNGRPERSLRTLQEDIKMMSRSSLARFEKLNEDMKSIARTG